MNRQNARKRLRRMCGVGVFCALAYVSVVILRIPNIGGFLTFDFKDVIITVAAMFFGPSSAVAMSLTVPLLELITVSSTGIYGMIMNVISSMSLSLTASLIYKYKKTLGGAFLGLGSGAFVTVAMMMIANLVVTPYYTGMSVEAVASLIPKLLLPFNLTKSILNASLTLILYKPLTGVLKKSGLLGKRERGEEVHRTPEEIRAERIRTAVISTISLIVVAAALCIILVVWNGEISFFDIFKKK